MGIQQKALGFLCLWGVAAWGQAPNELPLTVGPDQGRMVVYRLNQAALTGVTSVFVNGTYHASLPPGVWTDLCYSPGMLALGTRQAEVGQPAKDRLDAVVPLQLQAGQVHYLRVSEQNGRPVLESVPASGAEQEWPKQRLQQPTLSRVAQHCIEIAQAPASVIPLVDVMPVAGALDSTAQTAGVCKRTLPVTAACRR